MFMTLPKDWAEAPLPPGLEAADLLVVGPQGHLDYAPTVLVAHADDIDSSPYEWAAGVAELSSEQYQPFHVLDIGDANIDGHAGCVYLTTFPMEGLSLTQMLFTYVDAVSRRGFVITATSTTAEFSTLADTLTGIASSMRGEEIAR